ncbi:hypothetical protein BACCAP_02618 [Pseudoflavonifractor capillosus ATCC 29799]|uniref:Uncharacterized protein n=1 Tax=Pseudoflavonifractor capillosus ATCC 29799 TaxID=411467 RepID=A6NWM4_9FIRM|nr:hypothetical protein BACCAP_02618 [Pseudoflavonifractor capillosus ATCC 29799]
MIFRAEKAPSAWIAADPCACFYIQTKAAERKRIGGALQCEKI